jgi:ketosteroid isomerase-like protein
MIIMKSISYYLPALSISIMIGCSQPTQPPVILSTELNTDASEVKAIIDQKNDQLEIWYKNRNIDSAASYFAHDVVQMPPNSPAIRGVEMFKQRWMEATEMVEWNFELQAKEVKRSGDLAVELGTYSIDLVSRENPEAPPYSDAGNYLVLWELIEGDWKIVWDAPVSENPLPMPED